MRKYFPFLVPYLSGVVIAIGLASIRSLSALALGNAVTQAVLFTALAAIPAYRTGRMSYVDIAWPVGLVAIGLQIPAYASRIGPETVAITAVYLAIGLRMALPGVLYLMRNHRLTHEFARYRYRRSQWESAGWTDPQIPMQVELWLQALVNVSVLVTPALLAAADPDPDLHPWQIVALGMWMGCWSLEARADRQKRRFLRNAERNATCAVGLWRYSRHPNYFFQWLGWVALALATTPALINLSRTATSAAVVIIALALTGACAFMLWTLLDLTGIKPAEHFSSQKRPSYAEYQRTTSMFLPLPRRRSSSVPHEVRA